jgi:predicted MFS family arabinose efflux permease
VFYRARLDRDRAANRPIDRADLRRCAGPIIFGWIAAAHQLGVAMAAFGAGALRTALGTYLEAFMFAGLLCLGAALMVLFIGRSGQERLAPAPAE